MKNSIQKYQYIDSVRGIAILLVMLVHTKLLTAISIPWLTWFVAQGAKGVQLFFIASALTLYLSWQSRSANEKNPLRNFYIRRLFRIAPMFWLAIAGYLAGYGLSADTRYWSPGIILEWWYILSTVLFLHAWHPETITAVVPGGWSIGVEMSFYAIFPLLLCASNIKKLLGLLLFSIIAFVAGKYAFSALLHYPPEQAYLAKEFPTLWLFGQLPVFVIGLFVAYIISSQKYPKISGNLLVGIAVFWFLVTAALSILFPNIKGIPYASHYLVMSIFMGVFVVGLSRSSIKIFSNKIYAEIGKRSFSMYLLHFAMIALINKYEILSILPESTIPRIVTAYALLLALSYVSASLTYKYIEVPCIEIGKRLIQKLENSNDNSTASLVNNGCINK